jgi:hypothetical protein
LNAGLRVAAGAISTLLECTARQSTCIENRSDTSEVMHRQPEEEKGEDIF